MGISPTAPIETKICVEGHLADVITYAKFKVDIFMGYDFTGVDFCMGRDCAACDEKLRPIYAKFTFAMLT